MAGAFDFYVDESLLRRLLNDDPTTETTPDSNPVNAGPRPKTPKNGTVRNIPASADVPQTVAQPLEAPAAAPAEMAALSVVPEPVATVAAHETVQQPVAYIPEAWRKADELFALGQFAEAAIQYGIEPPNDDPALAAALLFNTGLCQYYAGDAAASAGNFLKSLELAPDSAQVSLALGLAYIDCAEPANALAAFDRVPSGTSVDVNRGRTRALFSLGRFEEAEQAIQEVLITLPGDWNALEALMAIRLARHDRKGAAEAATALLKENPEAQNAIQVLASVEAGIAYAERLAVAENLDNQTRAGLAALFQNAGQHDRAVELGRRALEAEEHPEARFDLLTQLANTLQELDRPTEAIEAYERALEIRPDDAPVLWNAALLQEKSGNLETSLHLIERASEARPEWGDAALRLATLQAELQQYEQAAGSFERCLAIREEWPEALYEFGLVLQKLGRIDDAQEAILRAVHLKPDELDWLKALERIAIERDDALVALDCHEKLSEAHAETPEMAYNLGVVLQQEGEPELAAKCFIKALEYNPEFEDALLNLGHALFAMGREPEARVCWSKAILLNPELALGYFE